MEGEEAYVVLNLRRRNQSALPHPQGSQDSPLNLRWYKIILGLLLAGSVALKLGVAILVLSGSQKEQSGVAPTAAENTSTAGGDVNGEEHSRVMMSSKSPCEAMPQISSTGWIGYQGKCYYFSETEGNWTYSQSQCSSLSASLAGIDSEQEKDFLLCYKVFLDRWIGLHREPGQPWRWPNGTEFDLRFPIRSGGTCAFLMDENWFGSSNCMRWRRWICSKPNAYTMGKGCTMESKV
ncbi:C-type lectin domain family 2 member E-like [Emydura macquarii macquarii]|uniref:C-type lectin domain family 2 member E-like n=1 Tax=Emydura macquarii macquarii TaxID=1129001 RepID=UPI00352A96FD